MTPWCEDVSSRTVEELLQSQTENAAWGKVLRLRKGDLVNSRLAKRISWDEYTSSRRLAEEDVTECRRRAWTLATEISYRNR